MGDARWARKQAEHLGLLRMRPQDVPVEQPSPLITVASHGLPGLLRNKRLDQKTYTANSQTAGQYWEEYVPPTWATYLEILMLGCGGGGGDAVAGAASTAAGGGGGGSGGMTRVLWPLALYPGPFYISVAGCRTAGQVNNTTTTAVAGVSSYVTIAPTIGAPVANNVIAQVNAGASGGKSSGATAGPVGTAAAIATAAQMPLGFMFAQVLAGQVGIIGSTGGANGGALTLPVTGLLMTGGTGGGGVPAISTAGRTGGLITGVTGFLPVPANIPGGTGGAITPTAGGNGVDGAQTPWGNLFYSLGGTGGGSTGMSASAGVAGGNGGSAGPGSGAGGGGGAFTAFAFGVGGLGGDSRVWMTAF